MVLGDCTSAWTNARRWHPAFQEGRFLGTIREWPESSVEKILQVPLKAQQSECFAGEGTDTSPFGASELEAAELNKGPRRARSGQWPPRPAACHSVKRLAANRAAAPGTLVIASSASRSGSPPSAKCSR